MTLSPSDAAVDALDMSDRDDRFSAPSGCGWFLALEASYWLLFLPLMALLGTERFLLIFIVGAALTAFAVGIFAVVRVLRGHDL